jgi:hypothetical protein
MRGFALLVVLLWIAGPAAADQSCKTAVYDQQSDGTYMYLGDGTWDQNRSICIHVGTFTKSFISKTTTAIQAAHDRPFIHVMYAIDRSNNRFYAPCGADVTASNVPSGVLDPGVYDLTSFSSQSVPMPDLGDGAFCNVTPSGGAITNNN